jgi:phosphoserine phosphatase RsbU/P
MNIFMVPQTIVYLIFVALFQLFFVAVNASSFFLIASTVLFLSLILIELNFVKKEKQGLINQLSVHSHDPTMDLQTAKRVQEALLSIDPPESDRISIVRRCIPATTLGGDFYTFVNKTVGKISHQKNNKGIVEFLDQQDNIIGVTIGDVAGHGVSSALVMALTSGLLGRIGLNNRSPAIILQRANLDIQKFISQSQISHVTAFYSTINLDEMTLTYSSAGHPPGIILRSDLSYELLEVDGIFMGMYEDEVYTEKTVKLQPGDRVLLYTDGIVETVNSNREPFGMQRLIDLAIIHWKKTSDEILELVFEQLYEYREGNTQRDDQTLVIVDIKK